jgi:hypothetical protein
MTKKLRLPVLPAAIIVCFISALFPVAHAQLTGPQQLAFAGLRTSANQGQFNAVSIDSVGNLYLLLDQKDGVRLLKTDPSATTILGQSLIGAAGDIGLVMATDPSGNIYVSGSTTSGALVGCLYLDQQLHCKV